MKEIHFYKDPVNYEDKVDMIYTHNITNHAIEFNWSNIHTYALSALNFYWLLDKGYKIYLHENGKEFEIKEGQVEATDKEIHKGHNIMRMWIAGAFEDYFYGRD